MKSVTLRGQLALKNGEEQRIITGLQLNKECRLKTSLPEVYSLGHDQVALDISGGNK